VVSGGANSEEIIVDVGHLTGTGFIVRALQKLSPEFIYDKFFSYFVERQTYEK